MASSLAISVLIPAHNAADTIGLQLQGLAGQRDAPPFEVVVVDNRSSDALAAQVDSWRNEIPGLRTVQAHEHPGAGYARNVGASAARADLLLCCDADDVVAPDWVAGGARALTEVELACGSDVVLDNDAFTALDAIWRRDFFSTRPDADVQRPTQPAAYPIVLGGNLAVRKSAFERIGGFDVSMRMGNEDNDFAVRAQLAGYAINRAPAMRIAIRQRVGLRAHFSRARTAGRGHIQLCDRHGLRSVSPYVGGARWRLGPIRAVLAGARMLTRPEPERDWPAIATRLGASLGMWEEDLRGRCGNRPVASQVGVGLRDTETVSR